MSRLLKILPVILVVAVVAACSTSKVSGPDGASLTLVRPSNQTLEPGETNKISIAVMRSNFDGAVPISFSGLPSGIRVVERDLSIPADDSIRTFTFYADPSVAPVVDQIVRVRAEGPGGIAATETFLVTVQRGS